MAVLFTGWMAMPVSRMDASLPDARAGPRGDDQQVPILRM